MYVNNPNSGSSPCNQNEHCDCIEIIAGHKKASTPEQLMRSRYAAFSMGNVDYLVDSSSTAMRRTLNKTELLQYCKITKFIGLEIIKANDNKVEFKAKLLDKDSLFILHEESQFIQESGEWKYDTGVLFETSPVKVKRNDLCPCGSGKKFKKCHS